MTMKILRETVYRSIVERTNFLTALDTLDATPQGRSTVYQLDNLFSLLEDMEDVDLRIHSDFNKLLAQHRK